VIIPPLISQHLSTRLEEQRSSLALGVDSLKVCVRSCLLDTVVRARVAIGVEAVDNGGAEVARWHLLLEEDVELGVGTALGLGQAEEGPYEAEEAGACVEVSGLSAPVLCEVSLIVLNRRLV
jgi:hypothetical protein